MFLGLNANAASFKSAITKYKTGNYTGCINELDNIAEQISKNRDNDEKIAIN